MTDMQLRTPKRRRTLIATPEGWYGYHAGYSASFVEDAISSLSLDKRGQILDPWNGTGITTYVADRLGYGAVGFDINPAMVLVAKSRCLPYHVLPSIKSLSAEILTNARALARDIDQIFNDPLTAWLGPKSTASFRSIERAIYALLIDHQQYTCLFIANSLASVSSLAAFFYVALFRALRTCLTSFSTSNPTWIKDAKSRRLGLPHSIIYKQFEIEVERLHQKALSLPSKLEDVSSRIKIDVCSSDRLPVDNASIDAVISSPPYCTRIDYAIATWPELAILGCPTRHELKKLRDQMIGTPTITQNSDGIDPLWGATCTNFLSAVSKHPSRASATYYLPYYLQYFSSIFRSLQELHRVIREEGSCVIVVQDSYFKDLHIDLPAIFGDMVHTFGWCLLRREDFPVRANLAHINTAGRVYRTKNVATESALIFKK